MVTTPTRYHLEPSVTTFDRVCALRCRDTERGTTYAERLVGGLNTTVSTSDIRVQYIVCYTFSFEEIESSYPVWISWRGQRMTIWRISHLPSVVALTFETWLVVPVSGSEEVDTLLKAVIFWCNGVVTVADPAVDSTVHKGIVGLVSTYWRRWGDGAGSQWPWPCHQTSFFTWRWCTSYLWNNRYSLRLFSFLHVLCFFWKLRSLYFPPRRLSVSILYV